MQSKLELQIQQQWSRSKIVDLEKERRLPRFTMAQLQKGKFLGKGGFCTVDEIKRFNCTAAAAGSPTPSSGRGSDEEEVKYEDRDFIIQHCRRRDSNKDARHAIKYLSPEVIRDKEKDQGRYWQGLMDFATETHFLTAIDHPNIVKLRAVAEGTPFSQTYFLVLDRLYDILDVKIPQWAKQSKKNNNKLLDRGGKKAKALLEERLVAAADLSDALGFMHRRNIVYRDIKAENIGFNFQGKITLFDFGLPKELHDADRLKDGNWKLSGHTGTLRYMPPEVFKSVPYNYSCDVYSFSILLWEMMALERAFSGYGLKKHQERVLLGGHRPPVNEKWPPAVLDILQRGWLEDTSSRPTMASITQILRKEIAGLQGKNAGSNIPLKEVSVEPDDEMPVVANVSKTVSVSSKQNREPKVQHGNDEDEQSC